MRLGARANMASERRPCVLSGYLSSTQADVELVEIFGPFGGEARTVHQRAHRPQRREVEGEGGVARRVCEVTVAVAQAVVLSRKMKDSRSKRNPQTVDLMCDPPRRSCWTVRRVCRRPGWAWRGTPGTCWEDTPCTGWCWCLCNGRRGRARTPSWRAGC